MLDLTMARSASLWFCAIVFLVALSAVILTHWQHRRQSTQHFHSTTFSELGWSLTPVMMVVCLVGVAFKDYWPV
jgi:heme/copper-type cytochrome/quinol oxidase subunit 2